MKKKNCKKKRFLITIVIIIILILLSLLSYYFISVYNINKNSKNMKDIVEEVKENNVNYVFLDINPSFTLVMQNDIITQVVCRNNDCIELKKSLNIEGKDLVNAVDTIYNTATEKGYDTKDGVYIKTTTPLSQKLSTNYIHIETIEKDEEENLLKENIDKIEIELTDNEKLIEKLEKDEDYGNIYSCSIINSNVECYLNDNMKSNGETQLLLLKRVAAVLNRFGVKTESAWEMGVVEEPLFKLYIDGTKFVNLGGSGINTMSYIGTYNCGDVRFNLKDLNLLNPTDIQEHFYNEEHDITFEKHIYYIPINNEQECGDKICKAHVKEHNPYCNTSTNQIEEIETEKYIFFKPGTEENDYAWYDIREVKKEEYDSFNPESGQYYKDIPDCIINEYGGTTFPNTDFCKTLDNGKWKVHSKY